MGDAPGPGGGIFKHVRKRWRKWLRALHRDIGYLAVGLTVIYAVSGITLNHIQDWDSNFKEVEITRTLDGPIPQGEMEATRHVLQELGLENETVGEDDFYLAGPDLQIVIGKSHQIDANIDTGLVVHQYRESRFFLRIANWLHAARGKPAWTYFNDAYAILLLYLAISGMFMLKGRLGLRGRGAVLIAMGVAAPIVYLALAPGPSG